MGLPREQEDERDGQEGSQSPSVGPMAPEIPEGRGQCIPDCATAASWSIRTLSYNGVRTKDTTGAPVRRPESLPSVHPVSPR